MSNKPDYLLRALTILSPSYAMKILHARALERAYSGAEKYPSSDWETGISNSSANKEIDGAQKTLISRSRELTRNNPYAKKAIDVIVSNVVGAGIIPHIKGRTDQQTKALNIAWKKVAETNLCDNELRQDFYALQALAMRTIVESGEVIAIKLMETDSPKLQLLEPDYINSTNTPMETNSGRDKWVSGILVDSNNRRKKYRLYKSHPGDINYSPSEYKEVNADKIIHPVMIERPGQLRGVPWNHSIVNTLKDFDDFKYATLVRQKIAACFVGVITSNGNDALSTAAVINKKRKLESKMTPGSFKYIEPGEDVKFSSPPPTEGYSDFVAETIREVAGGYGITYESVSGDYSRVNYSSGRLAHIEMRKNVDKWRWNLIIPQFCDPYMEMFKEWCVLTGVVTNKQDIKHEWVPPAHTMIDPTKEIEADKEAIKAGLKSKSMAIREQGLDPDMLREEIKSEREADKTAGLDFDVVHVPEVLELPPSTVTTTSTSEDVNSEESTDSDTLSSDDKDAEIRKDVSLNGAQISSLVEVLQLVVQGQLPRDSAVNIIVVAFNLTTEEAEQILGEIGKTFVPEKKEEEVEPVKVEEEKRSKIFKDSEGRVWKKTKNGKKLEEIK